MVTTVNYSATFTLTSKQNDTINRIAIINDSATH